MNTVRKSSGEPARITRRRFIAGTGAAVAVGTLFAGLRPAAATTVEPEDDAVGVLIDLTRCTGCESCVLACKAANDLADPDTPGKALDCDNLTVVQTSVADTAAGEAATVYVKRQCMHCLHPACVSACTVGALRKSSRGPVVYDESKCIGCRYCQYACPFGVPAYDWDNPLGLISKCQLCTSRLNKGLRPACVSACPNGALRYGKRHELLAQARGQIASNPERYVAHVYGEHEAGGTSMLYLSPVPFAALGFPQLAEEPAPRYAEWVMQRTPVTALTVAALATALHWFTRQAAPAEVTLTAPADDDAKGDTP